MKIVHLCLGCFFIDGYSYQENILPKYHVKMGYDVTVIASLKSYDKEGRLIILKDPSIYQDVAGFKVIRLAYRKPIKVNSYLGYYIGLEKALMLEHPDIIFAHGIAIGDSNIIVDYVKKNPNTRLFSDSHADYYNSGKTWLSIHVLNGLIRRFFLKRTEHYTIKQFGVTPWRCRYLIDVYGADPRQVEYLPMGVDDDALPKDYCITRSIIREELNINDDDIVIFTGGKVNKEKNVHLLIKALNDMSKHFHLIICGVFSPKMKKYIKDAPYNIHYLGWCDAERIINCMVASDIACFPGTHSTLWEQSVGVGLPIIFKYWDEMNHINPCNNGIQLYHDDSEEIRQSIHKMTKGCNLDIYKQRAKEASKLFRYSEIAKKAIGL